MIYQPMGLICLLEYIADSEWWYSADFRYQSLRLEQSFRK